jgi:hypothetical protein
MNRGRYFTILEAIEAYPVLTERLIRRLVSERRIASSRAGRKVILGESDIEEYLEGNRREALDPRPAHHDGSQRRGRRNGRRRQQSAG